MNVEYVWRYYFIACGFITFIAFKSSRNIHNIRGFTACLTIKDAMQGTFTVAQSLMKILCASVVIIVNCSSNFINQEQVPLF